MKTGILKLFSWVVVGNLARQLAFLAINAVLFERLSRSTFGGLTLAFGYMSVFAALGEFGIRYTGWRDVARHPDKATVLAGSYFAAKTVTSSMTLVAYLALFPVLWTVDAPASIYLLYGIGILLNGSTFDFPAFGLDRIDLFAKFSLVAYAFYTAACLLFVRADQHAWLVPVCFTTSMLLLAILYFRWFTSHRGWPEIRFAPRVMLRIYRDSWPLALAETVNRITVNYPLIIIGLLLGGAAVGDYRISEMIYAFLAQLGHMYSSAVFTQLSRLYERDRHRLKPTIIRMFALASAAAVAGGLGLALLGPPLFRIVFGSLHPDTIAVLRVLGIALFFAGPGRFLRGLLASIDRQHSLLALNLMNVAIGASVGSLLMVHMGIVGMAIGVAVGEMLTLGGLFTVYRNDFSRTMK